jgi:hypothetical protein
VGICDALDAIVRRESGSQGEDGSFKQACAGWQFAAGVMLQTLRTRRCLGLEDVNGRHVAAEACETPPNWEGSKQRWQNNGNRERQENFRFFRSSRATNTTSFTTSMLYSVAAM